MDLSFWFRHEIHARRMKWCCRLHLGLWTSIQSEKANHLRRWRRLSKLAYKHFLLSWIHFFLHHKERLFYPFKSPALSTWLLFFSSCSINALSDTTQKKKKKLKWVSLDSSNCNIPTISLKENKTFAHYTWFPSQVKFPDCWLYKIQQHYLPFMHFWEEQRDPEAIVTLIVHWLVGLFVCYSEARHSIFPSFLRWIDKPSAPVTVQSRVSSTQIHADAAVRLPAGEPETRRTANCLCVGVCRGVYHRTACALFLYYHLSIRLNAHFTSCVPIQWPHSPKAAFRVRLRHSEATVPIWRLSPKMWFKGHIGPRWAISFLQKMR